MPTTACFARPLLCGAVVLATLLVPASAHALKLDRCPGATAAPLDVDTSATALACLVNQARAERGLPVLRRAGALDLAAGRHARDMVRRTYFSHTTPNNRTVGDRVRAAGYATSDAKWRAGETLGWGTGPRATPAAVLRAWLGSPRHRRVLLRGEYAHLGIGIATGTPKPTPAHGATYTLNLGVIRSR